MQQDLSAITTPVIPAHSGELEESTFTYDSDDDPARDDDPVRDDDLGVENDTLRHNGPRSG